MIQTCIIFNANVNEEIELLSHDGPNFVVQYFHNIGFQNNYTKSNYINLHLYDKTNNIDYHAVVVNGEN